MYDVSLALTDIATQLKACRARDGLTLQQLASRCGVAASTIHKIEAQQMVPTVSVLLKIARGLGCRPEELVRDPARSGPSAPNVARGPGEEAVAGDAPPFSDREVGAWRIDFARGERLEPVALAPDQRAILFVERGQAELSRLRGRTRLGAGDCVELENERFELSSDADDPVAVLLILSPVGPFAEVLGEPNAALRPHSGPTRKAARGLDGQPRA